MNKKTKYTSISSFLLIAAMNTSADNVTIYRWVDKDNIVHFSQHQPEYGHFTEMNVANVSPEKSTLPIEPPPLDVIKDSDDLKSADELFISEMNDKCQEAHTNVKTLESFDNIQTTDIDGKKSILSLQQKEQQLKMNLKRVEVYCSN
jgi:hypothetical protein